MKFAIEAFDKGQSKSKNECAEAMMSLEEF